MDMKKYFFLKKAEDCLSWVGMKVTRWAMADNNDTDDAIARLRNVKDPVSYLTNKIHEDLSRIEHVSSDDTKKLLRRALWGDIAMHIIVLMILDDDTK